MLLCSCIFLKFLLPNVAGLPKLICFSSLHLLIYFFDFQSSCFLYLICSSLKKKKNKQKKGPYLLWEVRDVSIKEFKIFMQFNASLNRISLCLFIYLVLLLRFILKIHEVWSLFKKLDNECIVAMTRSSSHLVIWLPTWWSK